MSDGELTNDKDEDLTDEKAAVQCSIGEYHCTGTTAASQ
jgi:hypothetical protein